MKVSVLFRRQLLQESSFTKLGAFTRAFVSIGLLFLLLACMADYSVAQTFKVLHAFEGLPADGSDPVAKLVLDPAGNLYGTTAQGGLYGSGTVFKVNKNGQETLLHNFSTETLDGFSPLASLVRTPNGNLYGTTSLGGGGGAGTVFMLDPLGNETILYAFMNGADGGDPHSDVVRDKNGNLYGTTFDTNRSSPAGVVFKLTASAQAPWKETVLHSFTNIPDGAGPMGGLIIDTKGNLYGTTSVGGADGCGEVFELTRSLETSLFSFCSDGNDRTTGKTPQSDLIIDATGNLYGTTPGGGTKQDGLVFELLRGLAGTWTEVVLYAFCPVTGCADGWRPEAPLVMDSQGNLYGTTAGGGSQSFGVVFKLSPVGSGWAETVLHSFTGGTDGGNPVAGLAIDSQGNVYGTASVGGDLSKCFGIGCGTVFQIRP